VLGLGFKMIKQGPEKGAYYHRFFIKNIPDLCTKMNTTKKQKQINLQNITSASSDPSRSDSSIKTSSSAPGPDAAVYSSSVFNASQNGFPQADAARAESILSALHNNPAADPLLFPNRLGAGDASFVSAYNNCTSNRAEDTPLLLLLNESTTDQQVAHKPLTLHILVVRYSPQMD
jgi:hypothetical protein